MNAKISLFIAGTATGILISCLIGAILLFNSSKGATGGHARSTVLKLAHGLDETHPVHKGMLLMKQRLEELTDGQATLDIYSSGVLGNEVDCLEQVQRGEMALTKVSTAALEAFLPEIKIFSVPFVFRDQEHFWNTLYSPLGQRMLELGIKRNFRGLCYYDSGDRNFYTTKKAVRNADDLKGMKVRVMNSRVAMDMINIMGASPCPISWGELYTALAQGTVDAAENNPPSFITSRHNEVCKYFILSAHQRIPDMVVVSEKIWQGLSPAIQAALQQAADESAIHQRKLWQESTQECLESMQEKGVEIITPDLDSFRRICAPLLLQKEYAPLRSLAQEIEEIK